MHRLVIGVMALALVAAGCGDSGEGSAAETSKAAASASSTTAPIAVESDPSEISPAELGDRVGDRYVQVIEEVVALLADRPSGPSVLTSLEELKESTVQELVELGRLREALSAADRETVDARIRLGVGGISEDLFAEYQETQAEYVAIDAAIAEAVSSFNIITQYAVFDLLREQEPEEASRLLGE